MDAKAISGSSKVGLNGVRIQGACISSFMATRPWFKFFVPPCLPRIKKTEFYSQINLTIK